MTQINKMQHLLKQLSDDEILIQKLQQKINALSGDGMLIRTIEEFQTQITLLKEKLKLSEEKLSRSKEKTQNIKEKFIQRENIIKTQWIELFEKMKKKFLYHNELLKDELSLNKEKISLLNIHSNKNIHKLREFQENLNNLKIEKNELLCSTNEKFSKYFDNLIIISKTIEKYQISQNNKYLYLKKQYLYEQKKRIEYYNEILNLQGNIRVLIRIRPLIETEIKENSKFSLFLKKENVISFLNEEYKNLYFEFDKIFSPDVSQHQIFDTFSEMITNAIDGYNISIIAYGQTGSGKTRSMEGLSYDGIYFLTVRKLFDDIKHNIDNDYTIIISMLEVYNENMRDLLNEKINSENKLKIIHKENNIDIINIKKIKIISINQVYELFKKGTKVGIDFILISKIRSIGTTNLNEHSSRSHCITRIEITGRNKITKMNSFGKISLVDLAGSERVSKSKSSGIRLLEAQHINKSLSALGDVISARLNNQQHIPFRNSLLTHVLSDSLSNSAKTLVLVHISPSNNSIQETISSCRFGSRLKEVKLGLAKKKISYN